MPMNAPQYGSQEWLDALDYPEKDRQEVRRNRIKALSLGLGRPDAPKYRVGDGPFTIGPRGGVKRGGRYLSRR